MSRTSGAAIALCCLALLTAGCLAGGSPNLVVRNQSPDPVTVHVTATKVFPENAETPAFDDEIRVEALSDREVRMFTGRRAQYEVHVRHGNESVTFETRPICQSAETVVTVQRGGNVTYYVEFCEGLDRSGSSASTTTDFSTGPGPDGARGAGARPQSTPISSRRSGR